MKKLFISQPMNGLTDEEILKTRKEIKSRAEYKISETLELIDSYFEDYPDSAIKNKGAWFLGKSLMKLAEADVAYFGGDWKNARGCKIEHEVAVAYGIPVLEDPSC